MYASEPIDPGEFRRWFFEASKSSQAADTFFSRFTYIKELYSGNYSKALDLGLALLNQCRQLDVQIYEIIHKGTPFYWLGTAAFQLHDFELAAFYYDAAVSEDLRAGADPINRPTPPLRFIQIEAAPTDQAARQLVQFTEARFNELIECYNRRFQQANSELTLEIVRSKFLRPAVSKGGDRWRSLATALISLFMEWDYRNMLLDLRPSGGTTEPFFLHLFKGCVLFESLLKANPSIAFPSSINTLGRVLEHLQQRGFVNNRIQTTEADFKALLARLGNVKDDEPIDVAIEYAAKTRNTLGHNLGWQVQLDKYQYHTLFRMITSACLHAIMVLY